MKIILVTPGYKPAYRMGGPVISVAEIAERMAARGHDVQVFTTNSNVTENLDVDVNRPIDVNGVRVWYFEQSNPVKRWFPFIPYLAHSVGLLYAPEMKRELERQLPEADVVHTQLPFIYPTWIASTLARKHKVPHLYHQRGTFDPARLKYRGLKKRLTLSLIEKRVLRRATTLVALTDAEVDSYRKLVPSTPIHVIPNGLDTTEYKSDPDPEALANLQIPDDAFVVLYMGRLHRIKHPHSLLEAFARIAAEHPKAHLVIAGSDEMKMQSALMERTRELGLTDRVTFPGVVHGGMKLSLLARANVFALPSEAEGFSMTILESLASGTPVLISPGCYFPEIEREQLGRIVPSTIDDIEDGLRAFLTKDDPISERAKQVARTFVDRHYNWEQITDRLLESYGEAIARTQPADRSRPDLRQKTDPFSSPAGKISQETPDLSISLVGLNQRDDFERLLPTLLPAAEVARAEILAVVNRSTDGSGEMIRESFPSVKLLEHNERAGFGANHNRNFRRAAANSRYIAILNTDTEVRDTNLFRDVVSFLDSHDDIGLVSVRILHPDGRLQALNKRPATLLDLAVRLFRPLLPKAFVEQRERYYEMRDVTYDATLDIPSLTGCFLVGRRDLIDRLGGFDEGYFLYFEDTDLCRRVQRTHRTVYWPGQSIVHHWAHKSTRSLRHMWWFGSSALRYFRKWGFRLA